MKHGAWALSSVFFACAQGPPPPASLDRAHEACQWCRMAVSEQRFAAQLVAPLEEPRFFDDIGCLRDFVAQSKSLPQEAVAYVADHRTLAWVPAATAVYTKVPELETPMRSHLIAHADRSSHDLDPVTRGGTTLTAMEIFGPSGPPHGRP